MGVQVNINLQGLGKLESSHCKGIGQATCVALVQHGIEGLAVLDINVGGMSETRRLAQQVKKIDVLEIEVNVADEQYLIQSIQRVVDHFGRIDIVVNNATIVDPLLPSTKSLTTDFRRVIDTNLTGLWLCQKETIKHMLEQDPIDQR